MGVGGGCLKLGCTHATGAPVHGVCSSCFPPVCIGATEPGAPHPPTLPHPHPPLVARISDTTVAFAMCKAVPEIVDGEGAGGGTALPSQATPESPLLLW